MMPLLLSSISKQIIVSLLQFKHRQVKDQCWIEIIQEMYLWKQLI